mmetsp:Transcript_17221/g.49220  ORF Transcript_17221/g.49220 Transcript_17221/m.49220 type:complete len:425 (-) Transcript_17221:670-1944(-)
MLRGDLPPTSSLVRLQLPVDQRQHLLDRLDLILVARLVLVVLALRLDLYAPHHAADLRHEVRHRLVELPLLLVQLLQLPGDGLRLAPRLLQQQSARGGALVGVLALRGSGLDPSPEVLQHGILQDPHRPALGVDALLQADDVRDGLGPLLAPRRPSRAAIGGLDPQVLDRELEVVLGLQQLDALALLLLGLLLDLLRLRCQGLPLLLVLLRGLLLVVPSLLHELLHLVDLRLVLRHVADARGLGGELRLESLDLRLQTRDLLGFLVLRRIDLDGLGALCIVQRGQRLLVIGLCWRHGGHHGRQRVTAERLLQHPRQLRVAIRDEHLLVPAGHLAQGVDDIAERGQALVDVRTLLQRVALRSCSRRALGTGQVDEVHLGEYVVGDVVLVPLVHLDDEQAVGPAACGVHVGRGCRSVLEALVDELL